ncbi:integral membrane protein [Streptomyces clavuligerus]|nr:integral membrane protein [Streptomyces clavuligerus]
MAAAGAVVVAVVLLSHRRRAAAAGDDPKGPEEIEEVETPDVLEYMTMMVGVVYAIVLGLAIAGVWEARGSAQADVQREAQALHEISQRATVLPRDAREELREDIDAYVSHVVRTEWKHMIEQEELTQRGDELLAEIREDIALRTPTNELEAQTYQPMLERVSVVSDARTTRAENAASTLPGVVWFGLIIGALVTVGLIFTMRMGRSGRELLLAGLFSALIAFLLFMVWDFDAPFGRSGTDTAEVFEQLFPGAV